MGERVGLVTGWFWVRIPQLELFFGTLAILFASLCQCLSEETLKAIGPFYLVSMPGEVKDPTKRVNVQPVVDSTTLSKGKL